MRVKTLVASQLQSVPGTCPPQNLDAVKWVKTLFHGRGLRPLQTTSSGLRPFRSASWVKTLSGNPRGLRPVFPSCHWVKTLSATHNRVNTLQSPAGLRPIEEYQGKAGARDGVEVGEAEVRETAASTQSMKTAHSSPYLRLFRNPSCFLPCSRVTCCLRSRPHTRPHKSVPGSCLPLNKDVINMFNEG